jgi:hypothetical protein
VIDSLPVFTAGNNRYAIAAMQRKIDADSPLPWYYNYYFADNTV